jgi:hypothetical protein
MENFTAKDISLIVKSCKDSGVRSLKVGGLELSFDAPEEETHQLVETDQREAIINQSIEEDADLKDLEMQSLMISDPEEYERQMRG